MKRFAALTSMIALAGSGCGGTTGGTLIEVPLRAGGVERAAPGALVFTTPLGWRVTLERARIALGPFYFNVSPPRSDVVRGGVVILEATEQVIVDPLDPALRTLARPADGQSGRAIAAEIGLLPPDKNAPPAEAALLRGKVGVVAGVAERGGASIRFEGPISIDKTLATPQVPLEALARVNGAAVDLELGPGRGAIELRVDPTHWFDGTDFDLLTRSSTTAASPVPGPRTWTERSTFLQTLVQGVRGTTDVYAFRVSPR